MHGVPCSIKDQFDAKGVDTTIGFTQDVGKPALDDSFVAKAIKAAGGIPFVKVSKLSLSERRGADKSRTDQRTTDHA